MEKQSFLEGMSVLEPGVGGYCGCGGALDVEALLVVLSDHFMDGDSLVSDDDSHFSLNLQYRRVLVSLILDPGISLSTHCLFWFNIDPIPIVSAFTHETRLNYGKIITASRGFPLTYCKTKL